MIAFPLPDRFVERIDAGDCWVWRGPTDRLGYGRTNLPNTRSPKLVHRVVYELLVGQIPVGLELDHLCRNHSCVNPDHLEPVTRRVNQLRGFGPAGIHARKTHCIHGHPFDETNTRWTGRTRHCRACDRLSNEAQSARRAAGRETHTAPKEVEPREDALDDPAKNVEEEPQ